MARHSGTQGNASVHSRIAQALCMALNWSCKNGSCYSAKASYYITVPKWLMSFLHASTATGHARMARAFTALKKCNWPCKNGSCYSAKASYYIRVPKWLMPFLHASNATGHTRMAQAILALPVTIIKCQNGSCNPRYKI